MKKYLFILLAAIAFVACSNDENEISLPHRIAPIPKSKLTAEVKDFFDSELPDTLPDGSNLFSLNAERSIDPYLILPFVDYYLIDTQERLRELYRGEKEIPQIDFSTYSLIIGKVIDLGIYQNRKQEMVETEDILKMTLYLRNMRIDAASNTRVFDFFWDLYPKLPDKPLQVWFEAE